MIRICIDSQVKSPKGKRSNVSLSFFIALGLSVAFETGTAIDVAIRRCFLYSLTLPEPLDFL